MELIIKLVVLVFSIIFHEIAHGYAAYRLGDPTAKASNRLTLNPLAHLDPMGSILLPLMLVLTHSPVLFGWAKPVPFNPGYFRNVKRGVMPATLAQSYRKLERFGFLIIFGLLWLGALDHVIWPLADGMLRLLLPL